MTSSHTDPELRKKIEALLEDVNKNEEELKNLFITHYKLMSEIILTTNPTYLLKIFYALRNIDNLGECVKHVIEFNKTNNIPSEQKNVIQKYLEVFFMISKLSRAISTLPLADDKVTTTYTPYAPNNQAYNNREPRHDDYLSYEAPSSSQWELLTSTKREFDKSSFYRMSLDGALLDCREPSDIENFVKNAYRLRPQDGYGQKLLNVYLEAKKELKPLEMKETRNDISLFNQLTEAKTLEDFQSILSKCADSMSARQTFLEVNHYKTKDKDANGESVDLHYNKWVQKLIINMREYQYTLLTANETFDLYLTLIQRNNQQDTDKANAVLNFIKNNYPLELVKNALSTMLTQMKAEDSREKNDITITAAISILKHINSGSNKFELPNEVLEHVAKISPHNILRFVPSDEEVASASASIKSALRNLKTSSHPQDKNIRDSILIQYAKYILNEIGNKYNDYCKNPLHKLKHSDYETKIRIFKDAIEKAIQPGMSIDQVSQGIKKIMHDKLDTSSSGSFGEYSFNAFLVRGILENIELCEMLDLNPSMIPQKKITNKNDRKLFVEVLKKHLASASPTLAEVKEPMRQSENADAQTVKQIVLYLELNVINKYKQKITFRSSQRNEKANEFQQKLNGLTSLEQIATQIPNCFSSEGFKENSFNTFLLKAILGKKDLRDVLGIPDSFYAPSEIYKNEKAMEEFIKNFKEKLTGEWRRHGQGQRAEPSAPAFTLRHIPNWTNMIQAYQVNIEEAWQRFEKSIALVKHLEGPNRTKIISNILSNYTADINEAEKHLLARITHWENNNPHLASLVSGALTQERRNFAAYKEQLQQAAQSYVENMIPAPVSIKIPTNQQTAVNVSNTPTAEPPILPLEQKDASTQLSSVSSKGLFAAPPSPAENKQTTKAKAANSSNKELLRVLNEVNIPTHNLNKSEQNAEPEPPEQEQAPKEKTVIKR